MPRKRILNKVRIAAVHDGKTVQIILHPPTGRRKSWYAFWSGLKTSKSTGQRELEDAKRIAIQLVEGGTGTSELLGLPSDHEFDEVQRVHFEKRQGDDAKKRRTKSFINCMEAISAFRSIMGVQPITKATPSDCERFESEALKLRRNWRSSPRDPKKGKPKANEPLSSWTVHKWTVALRAAFQRVNRNAGRKCVRSVVPDHRLLDQNPWNMFTAIAPPKPTKRQLSPAELLELMNYFEGEYAGVRFAPIMLKLFFWSAARRSEIAGLKWSDLREVRDQHHFYIKGKWGVERWFRVPKSVYLELMQIKCDSDYLFASYANELRRYYDNRGESWIARQINDSYSATNTGDWFYNRVCDWSESSKNAKASPHALRKTSLQITREGQDVNEKVATDAGVSVKVMVKHYTEERANELFHRSNRTFERLVSGTTPEVLLRYGHDSSESERLRSIAFKAFEEGNWAQLGIVSEKLRQLDRQGDQTNSGQQGT